MFIYPLNTWILQIQRRRHFPSIDFRLLRMKVKTEARGRIAATSQKSRAPINASCVGLLGNTHRHWLSASIGCSKRDAYSASLRRGSFWCDWWLRQPWFATLKIRPRNFLIIFSALWIIFKNAEHAYLFGQPMDAAQMLKAQSSFPQN